MANQTSKPLSDKALREKKLAEALRANLRRRKTGASASAKPPPGADE
jgi:hypothetical protein